MTRKATATPSASMQVGGLTAAVILALVFSVWATALLPEAPDWQHAFSPAARALLHGSTPYRYDVHNPPWALALLMPFVADVHAGRGALFVAALAVYALVAVTVGARPVALGLWLTCPPLLHTLLHGNIEWMVFIGLVLPPRWGLFFVLIKPQVAGAIALWWAVEAWREGGWHAVFALLWPVTLAFAVSVLVFGAWYAGSVDMRAQWWNASLWPWSIVPGAVLLGWSLYARNWRAALAASPMLSPYVLLHAWSGAVLATIHDTRLLLVVVAFLWSLVLKQAL